MEAGHSAGQISRRRGECQNRLAHRALRATLVRAVIGNGSDETEARLGCAKLTFTGFSVILLIEIA